jgi:hypothetical protein
VGGEGLINLYVGEIQEVAFDNLEVKVIEDGQPLLKPLIVKSLNRHQPISGEPIDRRIGIYRNR